MENNKKPFSMEDFEKGLVLAGLILPTSSEELDERAALEQFDKKQRKVKSVTYFKRAVLGAEIVAQLHREPTFGRIKFQKLVYICELISDLKTHERYVKQTAGPFDNKFMHSVYREFEKQKWFKVEQVKSGVYNKSIYTPLDKCIEYKKYYSTYFKDADESIQHVITQFRTKDTAFSEIAATLIACYLELAKQNLQQTEELLLDRFYAWSARKGNYDRSTVLTVWRWVNDNKILVK